MEPTKEQIQWFWEQCEVKPHPIYPAGFDYLDIDPNSLFRYAIPALKKNLGNLALYDILQAWALEITTGVKDPALALFWAIYKALEIRG